jgi:hypothetical protein
MTGTKGRGNSIVCGGANVLNGFSSVWEAVYDSPNTSKLSAGSRARLSGIVAALFL